MCHLVPLRSLHSTQLHFSEGQQEECGWLWYGWCIIVYRCTSADHACHHLLSFACVCGVLWCLKFLDWPSWLAVDLQHRRAGPCGDSGCIPPISPDFTIKLMQIEWLQKPPKNAQNILEYLEAQHFDASCDQWTTLIAWIYAWITPGKLARFHSNYICRKTTRSPRIPRSWSKTIR